MLRGDPRVGIALLVLIAVVAGYVWYRAGSGSADTAAPPARVAATSPRASGPTAAVDTPSTSAGNRLFVHVAGRVTKPGVVELPAGSRVIDALEAAGGGLPDADLDRLNLAAKLADGQRVLVQKVGDPAAPADPGAASGGDPAEPGGGGPINLNSATAAQLEELPGIGPSYAAAIIQLRDQRGGFRSVNELRDVRGIGEKRFAELKDLVTV
jgi:competence protein ComEA